MHKLGLDDESHGEGILCGFGPEERGGVGFISEGEEEHRDEPSDLSLWLRNVHENVLS